MQKLNYVLIESLKAGDAIEVYTNNEDFYTGEVMAIDKNKRLVTFVDNKSRKTLIVSEKHVKNTFCKIFLLKEKDIVNVNLPTGNTSCTVVAIDEKNRRIEVLDAEDRRYNVPENMITTIL